MIFNLPLVPDIHFATCTPDEQPESSLLPEEISILSPKAVNKRRIEFAMGRLAARRALKKMGIQDPSPILQDKSRAPMWPKNIVGSITHTSSLAVAACASSSKYSGIGIDLEEIDRHFDPEIINYIALPEEQSWIQESKLRALILFSAKESAFKALFPLSQRYIAFSEVALKAEDSGLKFRATIIANITADIKSGFEFDLYYQVDSRYIFSYTNLTID